MRKKYAVTLCLCILGISVLAQDIPLRYFEIKPLPHKKHRSAYTKVSNSLYNSIEFMDSREDTNYIGTIGAGLMRRDAKLKLRMPFQPQLQTLVDSLTDSTAANGKLLFQLRNFYFAEESETRYCYLQAGLYVIKQDGYMRLSILDTVLVMTYGGAIPATLEIAGNQALSNLLASQMTHPPQDTSIYHMQDIVSYDSIEKSRIPLFAAIRYSDGIYYSYKSFSSQLPDLQGFVDTDKHGAITRVEIDTAGRRVKVKPKNLYAIVFKGKPYIATEYGYYPLEKAHNNLYFTGDVRVASSEGDKFGAQLAFGLVGRALANTGYQATFEMIIDPVNGTLMHLRRIPPPPEKAY